MKPRQMFSWVLLGIALFPGCERGGKPGTGAPSRTGDSSGKSSQSVLRVGHFPNITHAQSLVAHALSRQGKGWFEERLGPGTKIEWYVYNAGPSAMEAVFAGSIDLTYVGPSPALNAYSKSAGEEIRVIAGAAVGGAALVVQGDGRIASPADFRGKKVATPQLGNTQDVACRSWLRAQGFKVTQLGGDVNVVPTANPDQLSLFQTKSIDAVWTVEPWVSRLEMEAGGKVYVEEGDTVTTVLACRAAFLAEQRDLARKFARAHADLTKWMAENTEEAQRLVREELKAETTRDIPEELIKRSWKRLTFTTDSKPESLEKFVAAAKDVGFLQELVDISKLVEVP